ncbi:MAG TPA: GTP-binding protein [Candidatus Saccharimonadales bacterium]|nr:GTP-binding protein [Candidatus Saccharimonadales bacterium]
MEQKNIRNFAIIAHVDHGKSTLSDRLLELTHTIAKEKLQEQFLDQNPISRQRGITIKLAPVRMHYEFGGNVYMLNLIDTPGHVDFSYEVSRTLAACEGAVLLVDATQGIQAQTVAHYYEALKENLVIIPVLNKIDLPNAQTEKVIQELTDMFGFKEEEILKVSAKTGVGVEALLEKIIEKIPAPKGDLENPLRALIFDAVFDEYRGVVAYVRIIDGNLGANDSVEFFQNNVKAQATEVGYFSPFLTKSETLTAGEIGYITTGMKDIRKVRVGDTIMHTDSLTQPLPGYTTPKPMIFFGMYPKSTNDFIHLRVALEKLALNDTALTFSPEYSSYLGSGFRVGFLGLLHADIVRQRLEQEEQVNLLLTMPHVLYEKEGEGFKEPYMKLTVYTPTDYVGGLMTLCQKRKGILLDVSYHLTRAVLTYDMPYSMFIRGLANDIKSISAGFASIDYHITGFRNADLVNIEIRINDTPIDVLSELVYRDEALQIARVKCEKLKEALPRQQFRQIIQGVVSGTIVAREEISPFRKDVLAKMSGGDRTRKDKLLKKQKKGKSKMITSGKVVLPQEALLTILQTD